MRLSSSGEHLGASAADCKKRPPSRLQKQAPASLQVGPAPGAGGQASPSPGAWASGRTPIPLLSPLVLESPAPVWEADQAERRSGAEGGGTSGERQTDDETAITPPPSPDDDWRLPAARSPAPVTVPSGGWRHPALPTPVAEPASLVPCFQSQCAVRNSQSRQ